jgi:hypothetical protein
MIELRSPKWLQTEERIAGKRPENKGLSRGPAIPQPAATTVEKAGQMHEFWMWRGSRRIAEVFWTG